MTELNTQKTSAESGADKPGGSASGTQSQTGILEQARGVASKVADQAKSTVSTRLTERTTKSATELSELADALRNTSRRLDGNVVAPLIERSANQIERVAKALDHADLKQVVQNVESFARREPLLFLGAAFTAGMLAARFLKSGSPSVSSEMTAATQQQRPSARGRSASGGEASTLS